jgi:ssDNA-binding Zn-finger/Zn-ribbon topoisomerase 1
MKTKDNKNTKTTGKDFQMNYQRKDAATMKCPKCGATMREKSDRYGQFLGCINWPRCNGTRDVKPTDNSTSTKLKKPTRRTTGLKVIFPETMTHGLRQREPQPHQLSIYRHDDTEANADVNECFEFSDKDQDWMTLEDYCLERDLLLNYTQLIREGKAITRYHQSHSLPEPHKLPHEQYGSINGYRRCSLDRWYEEFIARS